MLRLFRFCTRFKLVRFLISGGTAASVTIGTVYVLTHIYDVWYLAASATGFVCAVIVNFILQKFWTFKDASLTHAHHQTASFFTVNIINFFINGSLMVLFVEHMHLWPVVAQVCSAAILALESFIMYSLIFRAPAKELATGDDKVVESELERPGTNA